MNNPVTDLVRFYAMWGEAYVKNFVLPWFDYVREISAQNVQEKKED